MKRIGIVLAMTLGAIAGCGSGTHMPDMTMHVADMSVGPDMTQKNCGEIILCALQSGTANAGGLLACGQGASQMAVTQAGGLFLCAAQHCISFTGDGGVNLGGGGIAGNTQLLQCLTMNCATQLSACQGLGL